MKLKKDQLKNDTKNDPSQPGLTHQIHDPDHEIEITS